MTAIVLLTVLAAFLYSHLDTFSVSGSHSSIAPEDNGRTELAQVALAAPALEAKTDTNPPPILPTPDIEPVAVFNQSDSTTPLEKSTDIPPPETKVGVQNVSAPPTVPEEKKSERPARDDQEKKGSQRANFVVVGPSFVRASPASSAKIIATLEPGTGINVAGKTGEYYRVRSLGEEIVRGYVHREDAFFERKR